MDQNIKSAASQLRQAMNEMTPCAPIRSNIAHDLDQAYQIQQINHAIRLQNGAKLVGRKIGLTAPSVQKQLGVDQPDFGMLYHDMEILHGHEVPWNKCILPKAEVEIAFVLGQNLDQDNLTSHSIISAVDYVLPCIEIVDSRIENWDINILDTIADNASASFYVLGHSPKRLDQIDILSCTMQMHKNNELVSEGKSSACMHSPINAMLWLAKTMKTAGLPLQKGDVILSGALGPVIDAQPEDHFSATISSLGSVEVKFGKK